jgi:hypothetical protein
LRIIKKHSKVKSLGAPPKSWISYSDGLHLCEFLHLTETLQALLDYASERGAIPDGKPTFFFPFLEVKAGKTTVLIREKDLWINATHLVKAGGFNPTHKIPEIRARGNVSIQAGFGAGTYVKPSVGLQLCQEYGLSELQSNLQFILEKNGYQQRDPSQLANTTPSPSIRKSNATKLPHPTIQELNTGSLTDERSPQPELVSNLCIAGKPKLSYVSFFTEVENGSFLPPIKEPQMQAVQPDPNPSLTSSTSMYNLGQ